MFVKNVSDYTGPACSIISCSLSWKWMIFWSFMFWLPTTTILKGTSLQIMWKIRGWAVKSTEFYLWCFWYAGCGLESPAVTLVSLSKTLNHCFIICLMHVKEHCTLHLSKRDGFCLVISGCGCCKLLRFKLIGSRNSSLQKPIFLKVGIYSAPWTPCLVDTCNI